MLHGMILELAVRQLKIVVHRRQMKFMYRWHCTTERYGNALNAIIEQRSPDDRHLRGRLSCSPRASRHHQYQRDDPKSGS
jgi:hypothetical protein